MAIALKSLTTADNTGSSATVSCTTSETPSATQVGDLVLALHSNDFFDFVNMVAPTATGSPTINAIAGAAADGGSNQGHIKSYWYVANTGGAQTVQTTETGSANEEKGMTVFVFGGADTTNPIDDAANASGNASAQVSPAVTPASGRTDSFVVILNTSGGGSTTASYTSPGDVVEQFETHNGSKSGVCATKQLVASGSTGTFTFTAASSTPYATVTIAIKAADAAGAVTDAPHELPAYILFEILAALERKSEDPLSAQATDESGTVIAGLTATATATHVAPRAGSSFAGFTATATDKKVAVQSGTCSVGLVARGTSAKKTSQVGTTSVGLTATSLDKKVSAQLGTASVGFAGISTDKKVAVESGRNVVGLTSTGAEVRRVAQAGLVTVGFADLHSGVSTRPASGTCFIGVATTSLSKKITSQSGLSSVGVGGTSTDKKIALPAGLSTLGAVGSGVEIRLTAQSGIISVGTVLDSRASKIVSLGGSTYGSVLGTWIVSAPPEPPEPEPTLMTALYNIAVILRDFVESGLASTIAGVPSNMRICIVPGLQAWDDCTCGAVIISVPRIYGSRSFPSEGFTNDQDPCGLPYVVADFTITVLRCAPMPKGVNQLPSCEDLDAAARIWFDDADAIRRSVASAVQTMKNNETIEDYVLRDQPSVGPAGGCVGSEYHLFIGIKNVWGPC